MPTRSSPAPSPAIAPSAHSTNVPRRSAPETPARRWTRLALEHLAVALGYLALAELVQLPPFGGDTRVSLVWPAAGLALAAVRILGPTVLPAVAIAWLASSLVHQPAAFALASTLAPVVGALAGWQLLHQLAVDDRLERVRDALALTLIAAPAAALVSASVGALTAATLGPAAPSTPSWTLWLMRDWLGIATLTPLALAWRRGRPPTLTRARLLEGVALVGSLPIASALVRQPILASAVPSALLAVPFTTWAGLRFGTRGAALVATLAALAFGSIPAAALSPPAAVATFSVLAASAVIGLVLAAMTTERDVAVRRRRQVEEQLRHTQKIEAVGRLAGGIAHDFNNLLTAIIGYADIVIESLNRSDPRRADVEEIERAAMRAADLTRRMLSFSRREAQQPRVIDLNTALSKVEPLLRRLIGEDISLTISPRAAHAAVRIDTGQIEQVIMNLAVNARDAMPRGGRLTVETADVTLDEAAAAETPGARAGDYVALVVSDTGMGIPAAIRGRIFEPYFTMKEAGKGTGLGLSTVYGIVQQSEGHITFASEVGAGTTFRVLLPRAEADAPAEVDATTPRLPGGAEHVLLVEDDTTVRRVTKELLTRLGYSVTEAASGRAGIALASDDTRHFDVALCDVILGDMSGPALAEALQALLPSIRVLYMSGYTDDAIVQTGVLDEGKPFLQKPFTPAQLARRVREVLDTDEYRLARALDEYR